MTNWITPYSSYFLSRYSKDLKEKVSCEFCGKVFITNIGRKRCSKKCATKIRKLNKKLKNGTINNI